MFVKVLPHANVLRALSWKHEHNVSRSRRRFAFHVARWFPVGQDFGRIGNRFDNNRRAIGEFVSAQLQRLCRTGQCRRVGFVGVQMLKQVAYVCVQRLFRFTRDRQDRNGQLVRIAI